MTHSCYVWQNYKIKLLVYILKTLDKWVDSFETRPYISVHLSMTFHEFHEFVTFCFNAVKCRGQIIKLSPYGIYRRVFQNKMQTSSKTSIILLSVIIGSMNHWLLFYSVGYSTFLNPFSPIWINSSWYLEQNVDSSIQIRLL